MLLQFRLLCTAVVLGVFFTSSVISGDSKNIQSNDGTDTKKAYMSFSGGGYHAHAGASAVMMSLMDRVRSTDTSECDKSKVDMCDITKNVAAISSNSGGSWFLSQAAYTEKFRTSLEEENAWQKYTIKPKKKETGEGYIEGGYFGEAYEYISTLDACGWIKEFSEILYSVCVSELEPADSYLKFLLSSENANWHKLAKNAVFGKEFKADPLKVKNGDSWTDMASYAEKNLITSSARQDWAKNISLIFASSILTDAPALTDNVYSLKKTVSLEGSQEQPTEPKLVPGAAPVMFTVPGASTQHTESSFFPGGDTTIQYGHWEHSFESGGPTMKHTLSEKITYDDATILDVAASSSAAGAGFINIPDMKATDILAIKEVPALYAKLLANFAPAFTFKEDEGAKYIGPVGDKSVEEIADMRVARLADGGFVDNTAVAYMVKYLADNGKLEEGFNILAMDNYPSQPLVDQGTKEQFPTGPDIAGLFGYPIPAADTRTVSLFNKFSFTGIVPHIFESKDYFTYNGTETGGGPPTTQPEWCAWIDPDPTTLSTNTDCVVIDTEKQSQSSGDKHCNLYLSYTPYEVTVKQNTHFGLGPEYEGVTGNLHVFAVLGKETGVVPADSIQAGCYKQLMEGVHKVVSDTSTNYLFGDRLASLLGL